ncbi:ribosome maturation factor RimM [Teredinibacter sp. KSP-S5-2]|uniref:ribosome maturation factor RimM n=1 Tax=Teredinibacter sp. KSP-S5-2 TaxID=3034506 RepID=UPI0029345F4B|nr:ribosome maturation factor RimM [Teredinibacter sp. KSP-S5-2]WNO10120.1 ribosome maturation factor RimM [Teredinibacter sp. KSP-S5-2]
MASKRSNLETVGRITGVFGIKGWVKVKSFTDPEDNIVSYVPWFLKTRHGVREIEIDDYQIRPQGLIVHIKGVDDRDIAAEYTKVDVAVERSAFEPLENDEFYWHQLIGLTVVSEFDGQTYSFGKVSSLMETGANDVLVISPDEDSLDDRERLIPYVPEQFVKSVDLTEHVIFVDWDPEF